ncbi:MAG: hypothetical protein EOO52_14255 [Gammaproteobacteria bacterium]|nr:MAG: hypothetical protein EOO52_14255 [Gammaproteobacteria bacterium]
MPPLNRIYVYLVAIFVLGSIQHADAQTPMAETVVHYTPVEDASDKRLDYPLAVLTLALSKTEKKYGAYKFKSIPAAVSLARSVHELNLDTYPNYFFPSGEYVQEMSNNNLIAVDFPLDHGLLSYRICFVSPAAKAKVAAAKSVDDLRKFTIGQGTNWPDIPILEANGFRVQQVSNYMGLFKMVMGNRVDLFCRGITELHKEYKEYKSMGNLLYNESFVLVYSMPFTLYFNKRSQPLVDRIEEGLAIAKQDGSLNRLFALHYRSDIEFAKLHKRKVFQLQSPYGQHLSPTFKSFMIDPLKVE